MHKLIYSLIATMALSLAGHISSAQSLSAGLLSSAKGFGITAEIIGEQSGTIDIISLYSDTYGVLSNRTDEYGVALSYTRSFIFAAIDTEFLTASFHSGAGLMVGYVHDYEDGFFSHSNRKLTKRRGYAVALACEIGARLDFDRPVSIDVCLSAYPGLHLRDASHSESMYVSLYKNGLIHMFFPQISLMYRF